MDTPHRVISEALQIRFASFFDTEHGGNMGADIILSALEEAGFKIVSKHE